MIGIPSGWEIVAAHTVRNVPPKHFIACMVFEFIKRDHISSYIWVLRNAYWFHRPKWTVLDPYTGDFLK